MSGVNGASACAADAAAGIASSWCDEIRSVGDPVDVVTGAQTHFETDFRVRNTPFWLSWTRHYDSRHASVDRGLGAGFRLVFDVELRPDLDGLTFVDGRGVEIAFPFIERDGQRVMRGAHTLERLGAQRYRVHRPKDAPSFEFELGRDPLEGAGPSAMIADHGRGRAAHFSYERRGLSAIALGGDARLIVERDGAHIVGVVLVDGTTTERKRLARYGYDLRGRLVEQENAYGHVLRYEYDASNRLARKTDRRGYSFSFVYDAEGRCTYTRGEDGVAEFRFEYKPVERQTVVTRGDGAVRRYFYDEQGTLIQVIDPLGGLTAFVKDGDGRVVKEVDPNGNASDILYNGLGVPFAKRDPLGHLRLLPVDSVPHPLSHDLPTRPAEWELGSLPLIGVPRPKPAIDHALPEWVLGTVGGTPPNAALRPSRISRDVEGLALREDAADGKTRRWGLDPNGNDRWRTDFDGRTTRYEYGSWNHLLRVERPGARVTTFEVTPSEKPAAVTDAIGTRTEYEYDLKDRLIAIRRDGKVRDRYRYDAADNLIEKMDGNGASIVKVTIGRGNVLEAREHANGDRHEFERDARGRMLTARNRAGTCTFSYDENGRRVRDERDGRGVVHRSLGPQGTSTTILGRFTTELIQLSDGSTLIRDPADQVQRVRSVGPGLYERSCSNGVRELAHYDLQGRCLLKAAEGARQAFGPDGWARRFIYSGEGDLVQREDSERGPTSYRLDEGGRLATVTRTGTEEHYAYDRADNLLEAPGLVAGIQRGNKLLVANGDRFEYDDRDNVARRSGRAGDTIYRYDSRDQLASVEGPGVDYRAEHDALGRRTTKTVNGETWTYYWDEDRLAAELFPDGRLRVYVYPSPTALVPILFIDYDSAEADPKSGRRYHVFSDHLGCPEVVLDDQGRLVWRAIIQAYGRALVDVGAAFHQPLRWPGHYYDAETGLHENRYRSYSPELGRYLQSDPIGLGGGLNLYAYTENPLRTVDLDGRGTFCEDNPEKCPNNQPEGGDAESGPPEQNGKPQRLSREDGQAAIDLIQEQAAGKRELQVTTLTELEDGRHIVTTNVDNLSPAQREAARALLGNDVILPDTRGAPGYTLPVAARDLPNEPSGDHGEGKGLQAARAATNTPADAPTPPTRQWSSGDAEHQGAACPPCEDMQARHNATNETGVQSQATPDNPSGRIDGKQRQKKK